MCEQCAGFLTERFFSKEDFAAFEKAFEKKLLDGTFIRIIQPNQLAQNTEETTFQCTHCGTEWVLSAPDFEEGWQGYFLPNDQLATYAEYEEAPQNNTSFGNGTFQTTLKGGQRGCFFCLGLFVAIIALIIYIIYSVFDFILGLFF
ncbi:MAG: hypothetical protein AAF617_04710 [Bacteroidota bacterium]